MEANKQFENIAENVLLKTGIVALTGSKDNLGCLLIVFQSQHQLLFTQRNHTSLIETLHDIIMYYKSPLIAFLVDMSHSNQMFVDHFIHVVDQLERKMSRSEIKRVYIVRPERKAIQKHLKNELGSKRNKDKRINSQVVIVRTYEELYQYIQRIHLTIDFGGTLEHDVRAWLAVQKMLSQYYLLVNNFAVSSADVLKRIRDLASEERQSKTPEKNAERAQKKRLGIAEKKKNELLRQYGFFKVLEDGERLNSYFQDPKLNASFQALSKSPVFEMDKTKFQQYYRKVLNLKDNAESAWKEGLDKMKSLLTEQELYDRLIECCTWIVEKGLPYLSTLPVPSKTLAEAVKQKINFENEFYKPVKVTIKKCRQILKEVRHHHQRSPRMNSGNLDLMADNLSSLVENLKTKSEKRMEHFKLEKDFMHSLAKAESWCERANDLWPTNQVSRHDHLNPSLIRSKIEPFLKKHPPLTDKELEILLDNVENVDDVELRDRARLFSNRCRELEGILRANETHLGDISGEEFSSDRESSYCEYDGKFLSKHRVHRGDNRSPVRSKISTDSSTKRWHDEVMSSTTVSNEDVAMRSRSTGNKNSRLADIQQRLRDQELLYEQLILEEELRELAEGKSSSDKTQDGPHSSLNRGFGANMDIAGTLGKSFGKNSKTIEKERKFTEKPEIAISSSGMTFEHLNLSRLADPPTLRRDFQAAEQHKKTKFKGSGFVDLSSTSLNINAENTGSIVVMDTCRNDFGKREDRKRVNNGGMMHKKWDAMLFPSRLNRSDDFQNRSQINRKNTTCDNNGNQERVLKSKQTQGKRSLPSHVDLLDGCDSLKRLCGVGLAQNNSAEAFETYTHTHDMSTPSAPILPGDNVTTPLAESVYGEPTESHAKDFENFPKNTLEGSSEDNREDRGFETVTVSSEVRLKASTEAVEMTPDSGNSSRELESRSHDLGTSSRDFESLSRDRENELRDDGNVSREEHLKNAREAVRRWTQVKNEQRARLTQVIDNTATRKEIEETYFNAQIQLCRAKQDVAKLSKLNTSITSLSLNNDVMNYSLASSFDTSLGMSKDGGQMLGGDGAFRRFVRDDDSVEQNSNSDRSNCFEGRGGMMLDDEESLGINKVNDSDEKEMVLDNEDSLGITGDVEHRMKGTRVSKEASGNFTDGDRVSLQENDDKIDSEQESSDEFDDAEEEELMLLCSQSSSGLLSQDELKDSLKEEQAKLEEMFRQQKEQLRMEREKLMEEEKRMNEWERGKLELKEENLEKVGENLNEEENGEENNDILGVTNTQNKSLAKICDDLSQHEVPSSQHEMLSLQHEILSPQHEIHSPQHVIPSPQHEIPASRHEIPSPQHEVPLPQHEMPSPQHEIPSRQHEIPPPSSKHDLSREISSTRHEILAQQNQWAQEKHEFVHKLRNSPQHEEKPKKKMQERGLNLHDRGQKNTPYFKALRQNDTFPTTKMKCVDKNIKAATFLEREDFPEKAVDETVNIDNNVNDLNEIVVSNFDSGDDSKKNIEDELINILSDGALETGVEKFEDRNVEIAPIFPPLEIADNHPSMLDDNDDIDLMNQLIDDLMISDHDTAYQDDRNGISLDGVQINDDHRLDVGSFGRMNEGNDGIGEGNIEIDIDNDGINVDDLGTNEVDIHLSNLVMNAGVSEDNDVISEGSIEVDIDNDEINVDDFRINEVDIDLSNLAMNVDKQEVNMNNDLVESDVAEADLDNARINRDNPSESDHGVISENVSLGLGHSVKENRNDSEDFRAMDNATLAETEKPSDKGLGLDVDFTIDLTKDTSEAVQGTDLIGLLNDDKVLDAEIPSNEGMGLGVDFSTDKSKNSIKAVQSNDLKSLPNSHEATSDDDKMLGEAEIPLSEGLGLDVDFNIELEKDSEVVKANDLIDLLRSQNDAFSSEESLDVDDNLMNELDSEIVTETSNNDRLVGANSDSEGRGMDILGQEGILPQNFKNVDVIHPIRDNEGQSTISEYTEDQNMGHPLIHGGHQLMSGDSDDDDFGRVLEDITEEESEYEDLMKYRGTQVNSSDNVVQEPVKNTVSSASDLRTARPFHNMDLTETATSSSFTSSIIIDPGTGCCKAGFSIDDKPRVIIPSVVGTPRSQATDTGRYSDFYVGQEAKDLHQVLNLHNPLKNGLIRNWELMEKLLEGVYEGLRCESDQYPVLLSEPVLNPKSNREEIIQMMFETFHVPATYLCAQAVLSLFATGRTTGLVYDCGYSKAHSVSIYEGYALPHATNTTELAGHELTTCLSRMLRDRGVTMETQAEMDVVQDIKEKLCYVVVDYDSERKAYNTGERNDTTYTMPDGQTVAIGSERFRCPEVLFTPSMVGMATDGVHEVIYKTALQCAIDVRASLFQNIVISGGSTMFPGFVRRLHVELCKLLGTRAPDSINIDALEDRNVLTWQGGAMLSKLSNFQSMWITSSEYEEFGPGLVYDCGYSKAHSVSIYEGYALPHATNTTELAGHELTTCLSRMLRDRGVTMETQAEMDVVQDIKEKLCYVVVDYDSERKAYNTGERNDTTYTMPDGQTVAIGSERFRCPEVLFTPSMVGMATDGVHEVIYKTALQCAIDVRASLFQNIVISGGSTMFPGFVRRLHVELCKLLGTRAPDSINIDALEDRNVLTWQGGAMLSKLSNFQSMWITSSEYEEFGPGIVHKKCV